MTRGDLQETEADYTAIMPSTYQWFSSFLTNFGTSLEPVAVVCPNVSHHCLPERLLPSEHQQRSRSNLRTALYRDCAFASIQMGREPGR
jgi:hypothetical protein